MHINLAELAFQVCTCQQTIFRLHHFHSHSRLASSLPPLIDRLCFSRAVAYGFPLLRLTTHICSNAIRLRAVQLHTVKGHYLSAFF